MRREIIATDRCYRSRSHLSQAIRFGNLVFTAGVGPLDLDRRVVSHDIRDQVRQALTNLQAILEAAGTSLDNVLKVTAYLRRMEDFPAYEEVYREFFRDVPPARVTVQVVLGHPATEGQPGMDVEIDAIACIPDGDGQ